MEETPNFDVLTCSQGSDLGQEQLNEIEQKAQAKSTKKATEWGLKKFDKWCEKRAIKVDLKTIDKKELNKILRKFNAEVKTEKGQALTPSALTGIRAAIHRHLTSAPLSRNVNILQDSDFVSANKMFEAKAKLFTKEQNVKPKHKPFIEYGDMEKLNKYFMEGQNNGIWRNPEKLVEYVWFSLCYHFARRGREGWRELNKQSFEIKVDDTGARYVTEKLTEQTKNHQGGSKQSDQLFSDVRMYETSNGLNPVTAFEFYLSKVRPECDALFQTPNKNYARSPAEHWYKNEPLGKNAIAKIMERLSVKAELSQRYTNHCVRASAVTHLFQRGVDTKKICSITKHKDERSLTHYINQTTSEQKRECSRILTEAFQPMSKQDAPGSSSNYALPGPSSLVSQSLQNQFMALAQPYPNCTQHIQIGTMNVYQAGSAQQMESVPKKRRRILESDTDSE